MQKGRINYFKSKSKTNEIVIYLLMEVIEYDFQSKSSQSKGPEPFVKFSHIRALETGIAYSSICLNLNVCLLTIMFFILPYYPVYKPKGL